MSEPKFQIGQRVAVCSLTPWWGLLVIPEALVVGINYVNQGELYTSNYGVEYHIRTEGWIYEINIGPHAYYEKALRPLNDGDYTETEEQQKEKAHD